MLSANIPLFPEKKIQKTIFKNQKDPNRYQSETIEDLLLVLIITLDPLAEGYSTYSKISNVNGPVVVEVSLKPVAGLSDLSPEVDSY
jgi:hypothetical protein